MASTVWTVCREAAFFGTVCGVARVSCMCSTVRIVEAEEHTRQPSECAHTDWHFAQTRWTGCDGVSFTLCHRCMSGGPPPRGHKVNDIHRRTGQISYTQRSAARLGAASRREPTLRSSARVVCIVDAVSALLHTRLQRRGALALVGVGSVHSITAVRTRSGLSCSAVTLQMALTS